MGCAGSKSVDASVVAADIYKPPPASIAVFDINTVEEPWRITASAAEENQEEDEIKKTPMAVAHIHLPILDKLESYELAPQLSWSEVSKALQDLKPSLDQKPESKPTDSTTTTKKELQPPRKSTSVDTVQDLVPPPELTGRRPVKENSFILRDRLERESNKSADQSKIRWRRPDPLEGYPERQPPGNPDGIVLYTTTLRGVRRTFEDCEWARRIVYPNAVDGGVEVDERDVSMHGEFLKEVRELAGAEAGVPRLFVMGRYVGGIEEMVELNESGKMKEMMRWVAKKGGKAGEGGKGGWMGCEGCGGARFVPCFDCNGSCKVLGEDGKQVVRCGNCNENGLVMCPLCR